MQLEFAQLDLFTAGTVRSVIRRNCFLVAHHILYFVFFLVPIVRDSVWGSKVSGLQMSITPPPLFYVQGNTAERYQEFSTITHLNGCSAYFML